MGLVFGAIETDLDLLPSGMGMPFFGDSAALPVGWLLCDGTAVNRVTYASLFAAIGTTYGAGDGSTTFNLPDARGRGLVGLGTHVDVNARSDSDGLAVGSRTPNHTHAHALTLPTHAHGHSLSLPNHGHSNTIAVTSSGSHLATHALAAVSHDHNGVGHTHSGSTDGGSGGYGTPAGSFAAAAYAVHTHGFNTGGPSGFVANAPGITGAVQVLNHTHTLSGSVGNPTSNPGISGTVDNNSTAPAIAGSITAGTAPYIVVHWIIKT